MGVLQGREATIVTCSNGTRAMGPQGPRLMEKQKEQGKELRWSFWSQSSYERPAIVLAQDLGLPTGHLKVRAPFNRVPSGGKAVS